MGYFWIFLGFISDLLASVFNIVAFQSDSSSFVSLMAYGGVVYAFICDYFIFHTTISGVQLVFAMGIMLITVAMAIYKYKIETKKNREENSFDMSVVSNTSFF